MELRGFLFVLAIWFDGDSIWLFFFFLFFFCLWAVAVVGEDRIWRWNFYYLFFVFIFRTDFALLYFNYFLTLDI